MKLRTQLSIPPSPSKITYESVICMFGSCFSDSIGYKLCRLKFNVTKNPFGTLYHPRALMNNLLSAQPTQEGIVQLGPKYVHYDAHSDINSGSEQELLAALSHIRKTTKRRLSQADFVFITLGTAWYFFHKELQRIVANCHKQPSEVFDRRLSSSQDIIADLHSIIKSIHDLNNDTHIILTVSPVRHVRDGLVNNNLSKSHLLSAVHHICHIYDHVLYFPSYELIIDDLRDYRFYHTDMVHPSDQAVDYVLEHMKQTFMSESTISYVKRVDKVMRSLEHTPLHPQSSEHRGFLHRLKKSILELSLETSLNFQDQIQDIDSLLR